MRTKSIGSTQSHTWQLIDQWVSGELTMKSEMRIDVPVDPSNQGLLPLLSGNHPLVPPAARSMIRWNAINEELEKPQATGQTSLIPRTLIKRSRAVTTNRPRISNDDFSASVNSRRREAMNQRKVNEGSTKSGKKKKYTYEPLFQKLFFATFIFNIMLILVSV